MISSMASLWRTTRMPRSSSRTHRRLLDRNTSKWAFILLSPGQVHIYYFREADHSKQCASRLGVWATHVEYVSRRVEFPHRPPGSGGRTVGYIICMYCRFAVGLNVRIHLYCLPSFAKLINSTHNQTNPTQTNPTNLTATQPYTYMFIIFYPEEISKT